MKQYALIGEKLPYTHSPKIHSLIFEHLGLNCNYSVLEVAAENISKVVESLKVLGYSGANVTIPYKEAIIPYLDYLSPEAEFIGAVNTIKIENGKALGYNTDCFGFGSMLKRAAIVATGKDVVIFGAGGAAKAMIAYFIKEKAKSINVVGRNEERIKKLQQFPSIICTITEDFSQLRGDIAVNATPVGTYPNEGFSIIDKAQAANFSALVDSVYNPIQTKFISFGIELGLVTTNGLFMLIDQAIKAEEIFQERTIDYALGDFIIEKL